MDGIFWCSAMARNSSHGRFVEQRRSQTFLTSNTSTLFSLLRMFVVPVVFAVLLLLSRPESTIQHVAPRAVGTFHSLSNHVVRLLGALIYRYVMDSTIVRCV
jgi:hypothetical protein